MLRSGQGAQAVLTTLLTSDEGREVRQVGIVDAHGIAATWTGSKCKPFAAGRTGDGYSIQGNLLAGPQVLDAMEKTWSTTDVSTHIGRRLLDALAAGDAAGGDVRGRQSAALLVVRPRGGYFSGSDVEIDLRVDDARSPVTELARILDLHFELLDST
jgi:uncharacterized Ntn-hydrolase superfamily protein